eukprot:257950_1
MIPKLLDTILITVVVSAVLVIDTNAFANNKKLVHVSVRNSHRCILEVPNASSSALSYKNSGDNDNELGSMPRMKRSSKKNEKYKLKNKKSYRKGRGIPVTEDMSAELLGEMYKSEEEDDEICILSEGPNDIDIDNNNESNDDNTGRSCRKLDRYPSLVLNADYRPLRMMPLSIWSWQNSVKAVLSGKAVVVDLYPDLYVRA